jgi:hypothetical protein
VYRADGKSAHFLTADRYPVVMVRGRDATAAKLYPVAQIVYEAVHGPLAAGVVVRRINGLTCDSRIANLAVDEAAS